MGDFSGSFNTMVESLERKEKELHDKIAELEGLNLIKNNFIGMAAHDLRNPLSVIEMYSMFLVERVADSLPEKEQEFLRIIGNRSQFMLRLINDLLDVSKIEAGSLELDRRPGNWLTFVHHNAALNGKLAERKEIGVSVTPAEGTFTTSFDRGKMDQVLDNLIGNAVKFSPRGSKVTVAVTDGQGLVRTAVTDEGEGIPADEIPHLFKEFHRGTARPTEGESSTGLGLAIARRIVEGHGGTIGAESDAGRGSTFYFTLPVA
jgi:signal transduction histidine kinase